MKRIALLTAAVLGTGCVSTVESTTVSGDSVTVYWTFAHFDYTGTFQTLNCAQAGVDTVQLDFSDGTTSMVPCSQGGVQGATALNFVPGGYWVNVTGLRSGRGALYTSGGVTFTKYSGVDAVVSAEAQGIPADLELFPTLNGWNGSAFVPFPSPACTNGNTDYLTYVVRDGAGIILAQGQVNCVTDPPSVLFSGANAIDKDTLAIRMKGWQTAGPTQVMDSCTVSFNHFANDTGSFGAAIDLFYPIPSPCL